MKQIKQQLLLTVTLLLCSIGIANAEIYKGSCGTNVTYTLDTATGVLNIEGTGEMTNWDYFSNSPWYSNRSYIKSASISDGVTSIGRYAFHDCSGLTSVTIPNSVTSIGSNAFSGCSGLTKAEFASIESLCKISFDYWDNPLYYAHNLYIDGKEVKDLVIPNSVTSIGYSAFYGCSGLTSVTIPNSVTKIGVYAFYGCSGLTSVTIPNSVTSIGDYAFYGCSALYEVYNLSNLNIQKGSTENGCVGYYAMVIHTSLDEPSNFQTVGDFMFLDIEEPILNKYLGNATDVVLPDDFKGKSYEIGSYAFKGCSGLTSVTIPNSVTAIGGGAFYNCSGLTSVTIPNSVTSIGDYAFSGCSGLTSITIPNSVTSIGSSAFYGCSGLTSVTIPNSVTSIGSSAFYGCAGLTSVTIGNSVTSIEKYAFEGCSGLTSVTIPNSVRSIEDYAFRDCSGLTSVVWNAKKCNDFSSYYYSPFPTTVKSITFGDEVEYIPAYLCHNMTSLTSVTIPNSVTSIGSQAFAWCSGLTSVVWNAKKCNNFSSSSYPFPATVKSITFGDEVEYIPDNLCYNMTSLTSVTIPNSVTSIGEQAFRNCSGLTSVAIPNSVTSIGKEAFRYCSGLTSVTIPNSVTSIGKEAFYGCSGLTSVTWNAKKHNDFASSNYPFPTTVENITFGDEVEYIPAYLCYNMTGLTLVTIPNSVTSIGNKAFSGCSGLTKAEFASIESLCKISFSTYDANPLYYAKHLYVDGKEVTDLVIPNSVTSIGFSAFRDCSGLTSVTIPNSVTSIGGDAFYACSALTSVTIGNNVTSIGSRAFQGCKGIKDFINLSSAPQSNAGSLPTTATVHVLKGCKSAYSTSSAWSGYNIVEDAEKFFPLENVAFEKEKMYVKMGSVFKLTPMIEPSNVPASIYDLIWMSSDPSVLYLDQNTQRFMAMKEGTATVTVTAIDANDNMKTAQVTVYVGDGIDPEESGDPQCDAPVVKYTNGNIMCMSATDNAVCHYTYKISGEGEGTETGSSAGTALKIEITAYATAEGYSQSKNTVKTFDYVPTGSGLKGDVNGDGAVTMQDANEVVNIYLGGK